jgi:hypothetical protein
MSRSPFLLLITALLPAFEGPLTAADADLHGYLETHCLSQELEREQNLNGFSMKNERQQFIFHDIFRDNSSFSAQKLCSTGAPFTGGVDWNRRQTPVTFQPRVGSSGECRKRSFLRRISPRMT